MRIDSSGLYPSRKTGDAAGEAQSRPDAPKVQRSGGDQVTVSPQAQLLSLAREALAQTPEIRRDVVEAARERLRAGGATWDGQGIAGAIVDAITDDAA